MPCGIAGPNYKGGWLFTVRKGKPLLDLVFVSGGSIFYFGEKSRVGSAAQALLVRGKEAAAQGLNESVFMREADIGKAVVAQSNKTIHRLLHHPFVVKIDLRPVGVSSSCRPFTKNGVFSFSSSSPWLSVSSSLPHKITASQPWELASR